jgi:hypothetical protein
LDDNLFFFAVSSQHGDGQAPGHVGLGRVVRRGTAVAPLPSIHTNSCSASLRSGPSKMLHNLGTGI